MSDGSAMSAQERRLLLGVHRGDEASALHLHERYAAALTAYAAAIVGDAAPDVVQSVFCRILRTPRATLAEVRDVGAWLVRLTRRTALNHLRTERRELARRRAIPEPIRRAPSDDPDEISHLVDALPRRLREVVVLRHVAGLTFDQMALALDARRSTVSSRYDAAIVRLRRAMRVCQANPPAKPREVTRA